MWTDGALPSLADVVARAAPCRRVLVLGTPGGPFAAAVEALVAARGGRTAVIDPTRPAPPPQPPSVWARLCGLAGGGDRPDLVVVENLDVATTATAAVTAGLAALRRGGLVIACEERPRDVMRLLDRAPASRWFAPAPGDGGPGGLRALVLDSPRRLGRRRLAKRVDACLLYNELDLLTIRLEELWDHVDHFVVVEADQTFAGRPKPLFFREHAARFAPYAAKLTHHVATGLPALEQQSEPARFAREAAQRNAIGDALRDLRLAPQDIVIVSDVDEIPRGSAVARIDDLLAAHDHAVFVLTNHRGYVNNVSTEALNGARVAGPVACRVATLRQEGAQTVRRGQEKSGGVIVNRAPDVAYVDDAGWHFSSLGGPAAVWLKAANFSHIADPYRVIGLADGEPAQQVFDAALDRAACRAHQRLYLAHCERPAFAPLGFDRFEIEAEVPAHLRAAKERYRGFFFFTDLV